MWRAWLAPLGCPTRSGADRPALIARTELLTASVARTWVIEMDEGVIEFERAEKWNSPRERIPSPLSNTSCIEFPQSPQPAFSGLCSE